MFSTVPCTNPAESIPSPKTLDGDLLHLAGAGRDQNSWGERLTEPEKLEVCARIKQARIHAGLTQEELAKILHVRQRTIANYESNRVPFRLMDRIAEATGVSSLWLLRGDPSVTQAAPDEIAAVRAELVAVQTQLDEVLEILRRRDDT